MIVLVKGTPDSGKSKLAEKIACDLAGDMKKYYIATMVPFGEEGKARVEKHRRMREGKGFETIEEPLELENVGSLFSGKATCLLECVSNLVGNVMFHEENSILTLDELMETITASVMALAAKATHTVIVTNEFEKEMEGYDDSTRRYVRLTDLVNDRLKASVDKIYEFNGEVWTEYDNN